MQKAISLRKSGLSYSAILSEVKVSKSTLSRWLFSYPLSHGQLQALVYDNHKRIERYRSTMQQKRIDEAEKYFKAEAESLGKLSLSEIYLMGLCLFWGEGSKTKYCVTEITNTDPVMIKFLILWFSYLGIEVSKLVFVLKLYEDSDIEKETLSWSKTLGVDKSLFRVYIKKSNGKVRSKPENELVGTCTIRFGNKHIYYKINESLRYIKSLFL